MPALMNIGAAAPPAARNVYSVSRLNREVRLLLERGLGVIWVEGELSNFSQPSSGHWYFSLKDRDAQLRCAMFRMRNIAGRASRRAPGSRCSLRGRISVYEPRGEYQLIVEHLEEAGVGALQARVRAPEGEARRRGAVRARAQARAAALPAAHRRHHLAHGCGPARHPARSWRGAFRRRRCSSIRRRCRARRRCRPWWRRSRLPRRAPSATS